MSRIHIVHVTDVSIGQRQTPKEANVNIIKLRRFMLNHYASVNKHNYTSEISWVQFQNPVINQYMQ